MPYRLLTSLLLTLALCSSTWSQGPSGVVINEVFTGSPDWVEIRNFSNSSRDLSGWKLDATFAFTSYPSFTFPSGTILRPGEIVLVLENSNPSPFYQTPPPYGVQVFNTQFGYGWIGTSTGAIALSDSNSTLQDLVVFGTSGLALPAPAGNVVYPNPPARQANNPLTGNLLYRSSMIDQDDGHDWQQSSNGSETPGLPNPGQGTGPQPIAALIFGANSGLVSIDHQTTALNITANITGIILHDGREITDPSWDVVIGGNIVISGISVGANLPDLKSSIWAPTTNLITAANGETLTVPGPLFAAPKKRFVLAGSFESEPRGRRSVTTMAGQTSMLSGITSPALTQLQRTLQSGRLYFHMRFDPTGTRMFALSLFDPETPDLTSQVANTGSGSLQVGVIGTTQAEIYNVFVVNPAYTPGTGPIFGVTWEPFQWQQVWTPLGTNPYHVAPTTDGTYFFHSPPGVVPPGIWLDHITIEVVNQTPRASAPARVFF
ncbi:MAG: hypothetical protein ACI97A_001802 [Planctomycetota bacterium]|jgi:hypothetical protein